MVTISPPVTVHLYKMALSAGACLLAMTAGVPTAFAQLASISPLETVLVDVHDGQLEAQSGVLTVPAFHDGSGPGMLDVAFLRIVSNTAPEGATPLFLLAGGPGNTYLDDLDDADMRPWLDGFLERGDIVLLEHRGSDLSGAPLTCTLRLPVTPSDLITADLYARSLAEQVALCAAGHAEDGMPLEAYTIINMAQDYHALRTALGYDEMNLMGGSYGSQLALTIIRENPAAVGRAVLYGVEGPDNTIDSPAEAEAHLQRVSEAVSGSWQFDLLVGDFADAVAETVSALEAAPLTGTLKGEDGKDIQVRVGGFDLKLMLWSQPGLKGYRNNIARIGQLFMALRLGQTDYLLEAKRDLVAAYADSDGYALNLMPFLVDCASLPISERAFPPIEPGQVFGTDIVDSELRAVCAALDLPTIATSDMTTVRADVEALLISGGLDGFTPPVYAERVAQGLDNAKLVRVPLGDHNGWAALESDPELMRRTLGFLAGEVAVEAFPDQIDLPPLRVQLIPNWMLVLIGLLLLGIGVIARRVLKRT